MLSSLSQESFFEEVQNCARHKAVSLEGGSEHFVTVCFQRNKVGAPMKIVDVWESEEPLPYCPPGFAEAAVEPSSKASETLSLLWNLAPAGH